MEINTTTAPAEQNPIDLWTKSIDELRTYEKKNLRINRIRMICSAACLLILIFAVIMLSVNIGKIVKNIDEVSAAVLETGNNINLVAQDLSKVDFETLGKSIQGIADIGEETLLEINQAAGELETLMTNAETAMNHINSVNFDDLNSGIQKLNDVLEPLAKVLNIFH